MNTSLFRKWWLLTIKGCLIAAFGVLLMVNPYVTVYLLTLILGITLIAAGALSITFAFYNRINDGSSAKWSLAEGAFEIIFGIAVLMMPEATIVFSITLSGIWLLIIGVFQMIFGFRHKYKINNWKYPVGNGLLATLIGIVIIVYPIKSIMLYAAIGGITLLAFGVFLMTTSQRMKRRLEKFN